MPNVKSGNPLVRLLKLLLYIPAIMLMPFWESGKILTKKAYGGGGFIRGIFVGLSGVLPTLYGAYFAANVVGWHYHLNWFLWSLSGALAAAFVAGIAWPAFYLFPVKPLWDLGEKLFKGNEKFAKNVVQPLSSALIGAVRHLPVSDHIWGVSEGKTKSGRKWGMKALAFVLALAGLGVGLLTGYAVYHLGVHLIPVFGALPLFSGIFVSQVIAATFAVTATVMATGFLWQYMFENNDEKGSDAFTAVCYSAAGTYFAVTKLAFLAGLSTVALVPAAAGVFVVILAYILPSVLSLMQGGFVEAVLKGWKKLLDAAYDAKEDKPYAVFFAQFANICLALAEGGVAYLVAGAVHIPHLLVLAISAVVALWAYASNPRELTNAREVSPVFGISLAGIAGLASWYFAPASMLAQGFVHGLVRFGFGLGIAAMVGLVVYPFAYLLLRLVTKPMAPAVGPALASLNSGATSLYKKVADKIHKLQHAAYDDSTPYSGMFGHLFILGVIVAAIWTGVPLALPFVHFGFWLTGALTVFAAINVYMLLAKLSSHYGAETFGVATAGMALLEAGHWALGLSGGNYWAAGVVGLSAAGIAGGVLAPAVYLILRVPASVILTPWLAPLLKTVFNGLWSIYAGFWEMFSGVFHFLSMILGPIFAIIASIWNGVRSAYASMFGRK
jgi:hypothetical protein